MSSVGHAIVRGLTFGYRPTGGVLQQARASTVVAWCVALGLVTVIYDNPLVLAAVLIAALATAARCGVGRGVSASLAFSLPIGILMAMINPIASQLGVTVWIAGIELPLIGVFDITREAVVYGLITGLRIVAILAVCAVYVATVDPDELLRLMRRYSVRSAMTASLAVRAVPVLARDGMNMADARECRPGRKPGVAAVVRGMFARSLDRASDAALALETRGFELAKPVRLATAPWRAADWAVLSAAVAVFALAIAGRVVGAAPFTAYPLTVMGAETTDLVFAALLILMSVAPLVPVKRVVSR